MSGFRLSPQQRAIFQLGFAAGTANRTRAEFRVHGPIETSRLEHAARRTIERHEILRTAFPKVPGLEVPVQEPRDPWLIELTRHDLATLDATERNERIEALRRQGLDSPLDAARADLLRLDWIRLDSDEHLLIWSQPTLWGDPESVVALWGEIFAGATGPDSGDDEPMQYADVAEWLNEILDGEDSDEGITFWKRRHAALPRLVFPLATDPASETAYRPRATAIPVDAERLDRLADHARADGRSVDVWLQVLWAALLARYCDAPTVPMDTYYDGRSYEGLEEAVGLFAKYLPFVIDLDRAPSLSEAGACLGDDLAAAGDWQEYYCRERLESADLVQRFGFESRILPEGDAAGVRWCAERLDTILEPHLLRLAVRHTDSRFSLELVSDASRLSAQAARQVAEALAAVVSAAAEAPQMALDELPLVAPSAETALAVELGAGVEADPPAAESVLDLIEENVLAAGNSVAVVDPEGEVTYRQLWNDAGAVAARLDAAGVGTGDIVAVCCRRSTEMVTALVGVLRCGAAYLPLDPGYPPERLAYMADDAGAELVLTHAATAELAAGLGLAQVALEEIGDADDLEAKPPGDLAYVIYTSGSTGRPKGVAVGHRNLLHSTVARHVHYEDQPERFLLLSSYAFDSSIVGLFWTLTSGATLVLPADGTEQDTAALAEIVFRQSVTHTLCLPTLYGLLLDQADVSRLTSLRHVIVAGEACPVGLVQRHAEIRPAAALINEYGPTEATVWATSARLGNDDPGATVSIGRAVPFARVDLVDRRGRVVPPGVPGEIVVGGAGVTRGYIDRPALTAERFLPDPYSGQPGSRLYRTGDKGRRGLDGEIEFLGRLDHQVKIRGVRIEPEEIEARLGAHQAVDQAVVVPRTDNSGRLQLVAYVVCSAADSPSVSHLRGHLQETLPEPMIPAHFVFLDSMPLAPNGKVDRAALPEPSEARPDLEADYVEPAGALERYLVEQWQTILQTETIGVLDNFFELGGNSIQAAIFMNRLRGQIDEFVHVGKLFEHPTVRGLAEFLAEEHAAAVARLDSNGDGVDTQRRKISREGLDEQTLATLDQLSDEEVDSMLDELLSQEETGS